jgi:hypothetical protein
VDEAYRDKEQRSRFKAAATLFRAARALAWLRKVDQEGGCWAGKSFSWRNWLESIKGIESLLHR